MDDYQLIISIITLLLTQMFYIHRKIGRLETKIRYCLKEIRRLNKQLETIINNRYVKIHDDGNH